MPIATSDYATPTSVYCPVCRHHVEGATTLIDDTPHCPNCAELRGWELCERCDKYHHPDDMVADADLCMDCVDTLGLQPCVRCGDYVDGCQTDNYGDSYCDCCYERIYTSCDCCGCEVRRRETYYIDGHSGELCESCYQNHCDEEAHDDDDDDNFDPRPFPAHAGQGRCFGVEIETSYCRGYRDLRGTYWGAKNDCSVPGKEFYSAILRGDRGLVAIDAICELAEENNWSVDGSCGLHVHLDMRGETDAYLYRLTRNYGRLAGAIERMVAPHRYDGTYCKHVDHSNIDEENQTFYRFAAGVRSRYLWFNVFAYADHTTIEIRNYQGTVDAEEIKNWVKVHLALCEWSKDHTVPEDLPTDHQWAIVAQIIGETLATFYGPIVKRNLEYACTC